MEFLKVSSKSSPASVAGAIAGMVKDGVPVNLQCVGAGAVNQAIKAESRTAIRLSIYVHSLSAHTGDTFDFSDDNLRVG